MTPARCFHLDYESRSLADITEVGAFRYAEDPSTEIMCAAIARDDEEPLIWVNPKFEFDDMAMCKSSPGVMDLLNEMAKSEAPVYAHNAQFEHAITNHCKNVPWQIMASKSRFNQKLFDVTIDRWRCTAAMSRRAAIPASLEKAAETLGLVQQKDSKGKSLIRKFSIPQPKTGKFIEPVEQQDEFVAFVNYCLQDVRTEQGVHKALKHFELTGDVLAIFQADMVINDRGVPVNVKCLKHIQKLIEVKEAELVEEFQTLTGFLPSQTKVFLAWLIENGYEGGNLQADTIDEQLESMSFDTSSKVGRALRIKQALAFASVKKIKKMLACVCADGRIRGLLKWYGAATGRWASVLIQIQNFKKTPPGRMTHDAYADLQQGMGTDDIELFYGPLFEILSLMIRHFIDDPEGDWFDVDFSSIEARILAWLADEEWKLEAFRTHGKIYEATVCRMTGMPLQEMLDYKIRTGHHHPDRFKGKVAELACIAENQMVLTDIGLVPIQDVSLNMRVFDGKEFVKHGGVVYQGIKDCISYENLTATPDHIVFTSEGEMQFGDAARSGSHLSQPRPSWEGVRKSGDYFQRTTIHPRLVMRVRENSLSGVSIGKMDLSGELNAGKIKGVSRLHQTETDTQVAGSTIDGNEAEMREPIRQRIQELRSEGDSIQVSLGLGRRSLDFAELGAASRTGAGPNEQRWALRSRQSSLRDTYHAVEESAEIQGFGGKCIMGGDREPLRLDKDHSISWQGPHPRTDHIFCDKSSGREAKKLALDIPPSQSMRTYDILNCGPRNRFVVSGVLVHNCGYQGGKGALVKMGAIEMGLKQKELKGIKDSWREANPNIVKLWHLYNASATKAVQSPGVKVPAGKVVFFCARTAGSNYLFIKLPSGRRLAYRNPSIHLKQQKDEDGELLFKDDEPVMKPALRYWGPLEGKSTYGYVDLYGGKITENVCQAVAADLMSNGTVNAERAGFQIATLIHDQCLAYKRGDQKLEDLCNCLTDIPAWADGLPIGADGSVQPYYTKAE